MSRNSASKKTLDTLHLNKLKEFNGREGSIDKLQREIDLTTNNIKKFKSRISELSDDEFEQYMQSIDLLTQLKKQLNKFENHDDEVEYYMNTAPILFQYYDILEKGKGSNNISKPVATEKSILKYFVASNATIDEPSNSNIDRATLLDKYLHITDSNYIKPSEVDNKDKCQHCNSTDRNVMLNDGMINCNCCNSIEYIIIDHERPSYKDPPKEMSKKLVKSHLQKTHQHFFGTFLKVHVQNIVLVACAA